MRALRQLLRPRVAPRASTPRLVDVGLPLGVFRLCDRQIHVMETSGQRCVACADDDEGHQVNVHDGPPPVAPAPPQPPPPPSMDRGGPKLTDVIRPEHDEPFPVLADAFPMSPQVSSRRRGDPAPPPSPDKGRRSQTEVLRPAAPSEAGGRRGALWGRLTLELDLRASECRVGTGPDANVALAFPDVLAHHATLSLVNGRVTLTLPPGVHDGLVNGRPVGSRHALHHGDQINLGSCRLRFERVGDEDDST